MRAETAATRTEPTVSFADFLRAHREARGWSRAKLADLAGVHYTLISRVEHSERRPTLDLVRELARVFARHRPAKPLPAGVSLPAGENDWIERLAYLAAVSGQ